MAIDEGVSIAILMTASWLVVLIEGTILGLVTSEVARRRGRSAFGGFLMGFSLGFFGLIIVLLFWKSPPPQRSVSQFHYAHPVAGIRQSWYPSEGYASGTARDERAYGELSYNEQKHEQYEEKRREEEQERREEQRARDEEDDRDAQREREEREDNERQAREEEKEHWDRVREERDERIRRKYGLDDDDD